MHKSLIRCLTLSKAHRHNTNTRQVEYYQNIHSILLKRKAKALEEIIISVFKPLFFTFMPLCLCASQSQAKQLRPAATSQALSTHMLSKKAKQSS